MIHSGTLIHIDVVPNIISPIYKDTSKEPVCPRVELL